VNDLFFDDADIDSSVL